MKTLAGVVGAVLTALVVGLIAQVALTGDQKRPEEMFTRGRIPDLRGVPLPAAKQRLRDQHVAFETRVIQRGQPPFAHVVCYQRPAPAQPLGEGLTLGLTVQCPLDLPKLDGEPVGVVGRHLEALGIDWDTLDARDEDFPDTVSNVPASWVACHVNFDEITDSLTNEGFVLYSNGEEITVPVYVAPSGRCNETLQD